MLRVLVRAKVWLEIDGQFAIGEGALALFEALARDGSLTRAAAAIGWSYRHAWGYLRRAERALGVCLTEPVAGRGSRRGTALTPAALALAAFLQATRDRVRSAVGGRH